MTIFTENFYLFHRNATQTLVQFGQNGVIGQFVLWHVVVENAKKAENVCYQMALEAMNPYFVLELIVWQKIAMKTSVQIWDLGQIGHSAQSLVAEENAREIESVVYLNQDQIPMTTLVR